MPAAETWKEMPVQILARFRSPTGVTVGGRDGRPVKNLIR